MTLVLVVRHGLTAATGSALTGRTPGISLDDRGRAQAAAVAARLADVRLDAILSSPLERCFETAQAIAAAQKPAEPEIQTDDRFIEVGYGDWTGKSLRKLSHEPLWRVVQAHPSAVTFPGVGGEALADVQRRAIGAIREWNAKLGPEATYLICSHGDVIKSVLADSLGLHLDLYQRIVVDPCSLSVMRFTPLRPFVERMNDTGGSVAALIRPDKTRAGSSALRPGDAPVGGGAGG
ncbi:MAG TPA: MSMEG_4193 family putative phosphomutase [Streptosporangiaceae bacterium]|nr:MSMEG_4193 family putative phosphomutase [Streptosporangiaceae bacterium]